MSFWDHRKPVQRARAVDVDSVAHAAVALLDEGGLRALTLRAVAQRIGVAPASLYSRLQSVDDLFDLALDVALADDEEMCAALAQPDLGVLVLTFFRHLRTHRWAGLVIGMRAPRGPAYLRLSERMCTLLVEAGVEDALGTSYRLTNLVIGSALTAPMATDEKSAPVSSDQAPVYARLHADHHISPESILTVGVEALLAARG